MYSLMKINEQNVSFALGIPALILTSPRKLSLNFENFGSHTLGVGRAIARDPRSKG
jgi:hypothetical protein